MAASRYIYSERAPRVSGWVGGREGMRVLVSRNDGNGANLTLAADRSVRPREIGVVRIVRWRALQTNYECVCRGASLAADTDIASCSPCLPRYLHCEQKCSRLVSAARGFLVTLATRLLPTAIDKPIPASYLVSYPMPTVTSLMLWCGNFIFQDKIWWCWHSLEAHRALI